MTAQNKKIVVVGGGAGGLELATRLGNKLGHKKQAEITLVDCCQSHLWKPLLHKIASGSLDDNFEVLSYLSHAHSHHFRFQRGALTHIEREFKTLRLAPILDESGIELVPSRVLNYDILVIALGSISNDFGIAGVKDRCMFLDNLQQARSLYNKMLNLFLKYSVCVEKKRPINIAIVGGGATGVELSAEVYNMVKQLRRYSLQDLDITMLNLTLVEASERILPALPYSISSAAHIELRKLGASVLTNTIVTSVTDGGLNVEGGKFIKSDLMIWVAGIKVPDFMKDIGGLETNRINQLLVKQTLQTTLDPNIFAIGDCASCPQEQGGPVPPRAQSAHQMASCCFTNILAIMNGKMLQAYIYKDYGSLVSLSCFSTIGRLMGSLIFRSMMIKGRLAYFFYILLYRMHQFVLHGCLKTALLILVSYINRVLRPRFKMH